MFKFCKFVSIDLLILLYYSFLHYQLQYCVISWGTANNSVLQPLSVLQNNMLRIIILANVNLICITPSKSNDNYQFELAKFMHKFYHGKLP